MHPARGRLTLVLKRPTLTVAERAGLEALGEETQNELWVVLEG